MSQDLDIFDEYDMNKLRKAEKLIVEVYEYNYASPNSQRAISRLETILSKLAVFTKTTEVGYDHNRSK